MFLITLALILVLVFGVGGEWGWGGLTQNLFQGVQKFCHAKNKKIITCETKETK